MSVNSSHPRDENNGTEWWQEYEGGHSTHYEQQNIMSKNSYWSLSLSMNSPLLLWQTSQAQWWANEKDEIENGGVLSVWTDYLSCQCGAKCLSRYNMYSMPWLSNFYCWEFSPEEMIPAIKRLHVHVKKKKVKRLYTQVFIVALVPFVKFKRWHKYSKGYLGHRL